MVSAIQNSQYQALPDMLASDRFVFLFSKVPNWGGNVFNDLCIKALGAMIPGVSQEDFQVTIAGFVRNFRGRRVFSHTTQINFAETVDMTTHNSFRNWFEYISGTNSGLSQGYVKDYAVTASLYTFDTTGLQADLANFYNIRPVDLPDTQLSGESTQAMQTSISLRWDYADFANITVL